MLLSHPEYVAHTLRALGLVPEEGQYQFDGRNLSADGITDAAIAAVEGSLDINTLDMQAKLEATLQARRENYAKLNQDELRFDDIMNGTTTWKDSVMAIKSRFPK